MFKILREAWFEFLFVKKKRCTCTPLNISNTCFEIADKKLIFCLQMRIINTSVVFWRLTLFAAWFKFVVVKKKVAFTSFSNLNTCDEFPEKKGFFTFAYKWESSNLLCLPSSCKVLIVDCRVDRANRKGFRDLISGDPSIQSLQSLFMLM